MKPSFANDDHQWSEQLRDSSCQRNLWPTRVRGTVAPVLVPGMLPPIASTHLFEDLPYYETFYRRSVQQHMQWSVPVAAVIAGALTIGVLPTSPAHAGGGAAASGTIDTLGTAKAILYSEPVDTTVPEAAADAPAPAAEAPTTPTTAAPEPVAAAAPAPTPVVTTAPKKAPAPRVTKAPAPTTTTTVVRTTPVPSTSTAIRAATPAPPAPTNCSASQDAAHACWDDLINQYGWNHADAFNVMWCESTGNPNARNPHSTATGLFQILGGPTDPEDNVRQAYEMYQDRGWQPWVCKP